MRVALACLVLACELWGQSAWKRHTIDKSLLGADGVRLGDLNGDGLPDIATGWEEGRQVRVYYHPPQKEARAAERWRAETVGKVCAAEDALFVDLDGDGKQDVVSSCEEGQPTGVFVHWGPDWKTERIGAASASKRWIYALPLRLAGRTQGALVAGGKAEGAELLLLRPPTQGSLRDLSKWSGESLGKMGWTMSLIAHDMDQDGDLDILVSDRRGVRSGIFWLEAPAWTRHDIAASGEEVMFIDIYRDENRRGYLAAAIAPNKVRIYVEPADPRLPWVTREVPYPSRAGSAKAVAWGDFNQDGLRDLAFSCENAGVDGKEGVWWLESRPDGGWVPHAVSGGEGIKFDRIEVLDVDGDGDLDLLTTEERRGLGVVWYENPGRP